MEGEATHFIEQFTSVYNKKHFRNSNVLDITHLQIALQSTINTPGIKTVAVFKIKFKNDAGKKTH